MQLSFRMVRKWRSRIFHEPSPDGRTRDLFPLPTLKEEQAVRGGVCRAVARRVQRRGHIIKRVNMAITSLNSLFFGKSGITGGEVSNISSLPLCQRLCIKDLISAVVPSQPMQATQEPFRRSEYPVAAMNWKPGLGKSQT